MSIIYLIMHCLLFALEDFSFEMFSLVRDDIVDNIVRTVLGKFDIVL